MRNIGHSYYVAELMFKGASNLMHLYQTIEELFILYQRCCLSRILNNF